MTGHTAETLVYRYLKPSDIRGHLCWSEVDSSVTLAESRGGEFVEIATFDLREERKEKAVSFFRSFKGDDTNRILDVLNELRYRRTRSGKLADSGFAVNAGMMRINYELAHEDLNDEHEVIIFKDDDDSNRECRHYGLTITPNATTPRLEIINALLELSKFFALKQTSKKPDTREIMEFSDAESAFFSIASSVIIGNPPAIT
ncbi:TPA: hypothetical protein NDU34_005768 [Pseudomonas aeruginosa]|uniref:hypothetical protein n=1 Tax=Pseudomonas aeruginosa TaxID=287 RepID=UPI001AAF13FB|nr:hypothetical protein [Pseudomonas aeruginosa]MBO2835043.1 hypothetical protein [Pseudomonas aeruginosa]HBN9701310.1 hypothetical protein [Pseudomonas aeruginosa]HBN9720254.1 hypothetical protein [Pseudomonas aeruginosa]HBN9765399.1 hypothetical protein [Pseudomonas aeruginosa]HBN9888011.1 hypothetical protein [Pseudomonas aeruginosa]